MQPLRICPHWKVKKMKMIPLEWKKWTKTFKKLC